MDIDMVLWGWFEVEKEQGNIVIRGQETNGNTFTIRTRRVNEVQELISDLQKIVSNPQPKENEVQIK